MKASEVVSCIKGCADFYQERYGHMEFHCWLCDKAVKNKCGGIDDVDATVNAYLEKRGIEDETK